MTRNLIVLTLFAAVAFVGDRPSPGRAGPPEPPPPVDGNSLRPGMTQDEVRRLLGPPKRMARQILYRRYLEQWVYEGANPVRIEFDCVRGKEPQILTVHPLTPIHP
jgi:hypothetical protein